MYLRRTLLHQQPEQEKEEGSADAPDEERRRPPADNLKRGLVVLLRLELVLVQDVLVRDRDRVREERPRGVRRDADVDRLGDLPRFDDLRALERQLCTLDEQREKRTTPMPDEKMIM